MFSTRRTRSRSLALLASALLSVLTLGAGCGDSDGSPDPSMQKSGLGDCTANSDTDQAAGQALVVQFCDGCHSSQVTGAARMRAPTNLNWDNLATVRAYADEIWHQIAIGAMPPGSRPKLSTAQAAQVKTWLACGAMDRSVAPADGGPSGEASSGSDASRD